jgi:hypothetical protein
MDPAGSETSAWAATRCAEPGRPCIEPGVCLPGSHGAPEGHARAGRVQGVGPRQSTKEACAPRSPHGTGGEGGGKGAGQGERGGGNQEPATGPGPPVPCAQPRTAGTCGCLHVRPEAGARCGRAARRDLCGGCWVTGIPTATASGGPFGAGGEGGDPTTCLHLWEFAAPGTACARPVAVPRMNHSLVREAVQGNMACTLG